MVTCEGQYFYMYVVPKVFHSTTSVIHIFALTRRAAVIAGVIGTTAHAAGVVDDQLEPWFRRWRHSDGPKTGWHLSQPNPALVRHLVDDSR